MARGRLPPVDVERRIAAHEKRKIGAIKIAEVPSSDPNKLPYGIFIGSDHVVFCSCPSWLYDPREIQSCKHLMAFFAEVQKRGRS